MSIINNILMGQWTFSLRYVKINLFISDNTSSKLARDWSPVALSSGLMFSPWSIMRTLIRFYLVPSGKLLVPCHAWASLGHVDDRVGCLTTHKEQALLQLPNSRVWTMRTHSQGLLEKSSMEIGQADIQSCFTRHLTQKTAIHRNKQK